MSPAIFTVRPERGRRHALDGPFHRVPVDQQQREEHRADEHAERHACPGEDVAGAA